MAEERKTDTPDSDAVSDLHVPTSWEFIDNPPTTEDVILKLKSLPDMWGIRPEEFVEYVQPLSQSKNVAVQKGVKDYKNVWTLYFTVAGRVAMVNQAAIKNEWRVEFTPEPVTPTGIPGFLEYGERIVYREYCEIYVRTPNVSSEWQLLGRRPGTAWVPGTGGAGAVASNRFEKVETSARGRAIGAWGIGVIPGSGVASLDEMLSVNDLRASAQQGQQRGGRESTPRVQQSRPDLMSAVRVNLAEYQALTGLSDEAMDSRTQSYCGKTFGKQLEKDENEAWVLDPLKDGELALFASRMKGEVERVKNEQSLG